MDHSSKPYRVAWPVIGCVEMHLPSDSSFTRKFGKRVKDIGGKYSECRGSRYNRFVDIPLRWAVGEGSFSEAFQEGVRLADEIAQTFHPRCLIIRSTVQEEGCLGVHPIDFRDSVPSVQTLVNKFLKSVASYYDRRAGEDGLDAFDRLKIVKRGKDFWGDSKGPYVEAWRRLFAWTVKTAVGLRGWRDHEADKPTRNPQLEENAWARLERDLWAWKERHGLLITSGPIDSPEMALLKRTGS